MKKTKNMAKKKKKTDKDSKTDGDINLLETKESMDRLTELLYSLGRQDTSLKSITNPGNRRTIFPIIKTDVDPFFILLTD